MNLYKCFKLKLIIVLLYCIVILPTSHVESQTLKILPIGNSITQLDNQHFSYRYNLWKKLIDDGVDFDYIGSHTDHYNCGTPTFPDYNGHTFDMDHEGHWGWRCDEIINGGSSSNCKGTGNLSTWLGSYTPDIALIHLGTNDMAQGQTVSSTINELKDIITTMRADNPDIIILLAKLIPADESQHSWAWRIPTLNAEIPSIAVDLQDENSPIIIVDQFSGFDPTTDTFDGVHTNSLGEEKMAQKWFDAIHSVLGSGFGLNIKTYLEGPYNGSKMNTALLANIPLQQPFNVGPWNYTGTESVETLPTANIVDWVLVELRDSPDAVSANESTRIEQKAGFLLDNGSIVDLDGTSYLTFNSSVTNQLFVVIHHKSHLAILSANPLTENNGVYAYDFSTAANKAYGNSQNDLDSSVFGMIAGDFNSDGVIDTNDLTKWSIKAGLKGYYQADVDLNSNVDNLDKNMFWFNNQGLSSSLP